MKLLGNRVLIQLDEEVSHTKLASGIEVPKVRFEETDGGKLKSRVESLGYLSQGTVVDVSPLALKSIQEESATLSKGDRVLVNPLAVAPNYQFYTDRANKIQLFNGLISVPTSLIEAIIND